MLIGHSRNKCILEWLHLNGPGFCFVSENKFFFFSFFYLVYKSQASGKLDNAPGNSNMGEVAHSMQPVYKEFA